MDHTEIQRLLRQELDYLGRQRDSLDEDIFRLRGQVTSLVKQALSNEVRQRAIQDSAKILGIDLSAEEDPPFDRSKPLESQLDR